MSSLAPALARDVLFFGGKGGVGKTTLAAAAALASGDGGTPTLLVSTDPAHSTSDILQIDLGPDSRPVCPNVWALEIDPVTEAERYIDDVKARIAEATAPRLLAEVERQIDIARVSPGAQEAALFDRFARILDEERARYGRVVFDTAPTGQTLRLLSLPELMAAWIGGLAGRRRRVAALGRMWRTVAGAAAGDEGRAGDPVLAALEERRDRFHRVRGILTDPTRAAFIFVLVPERLPIRETERAVRALAKHGVPVGGILVNQVLPPAVGDAFHARRRTREQEGLALIEESLGDWPLARIPLLEADPIGIDALRALASLFAGGLRPAASGEDGEP